MAPSPSHHPIPTQSQPRTTPPYESDDDEDDRMLLRTFLPYEIAYRPTPTKRRRALWLFRAHDDVTLHGQHYQIREAGADASGALVYRLVHEHARPLDPTLHVPAWEMGIHAAPWPFVRTPTRLTPRLAAAAAGVGVRVAPSPLGGMGLFAAFDLPAGHSVPYGGRLSAIQRDQGEYNCQLASGVYLIADDPADRGPGALANDCTVVVDPVGTVRSTDVAPNATLQWTVPTDGYLEEWAGGRNDGSAFRMQLELAVSVPAGTEITVAYGDAYWRDEAVGSRMSHPQIVC